jgi:hypothetical protein
LTVTTTTSQLGWCKTFSLFSFFTFFLVFIFVLFFANTAMDQRFSSFDLWTKKRRNNLSSYFREKVQPHGVVAAIFSISSAF